MSDLGELAGRLAETVDAPTAAELLAEHLRARWPAAAVRVYLRGPGDTCDTCLRARDCTNRDACFHLVASQGAFALPPGHAARIPLSDTCWAGDRVCIDARIPPELEAPEAVATASDTVMVAPLLAGGERVGAVGVRTLDPLPEGAGTELEIDALLAASTFRLLAVQESEARRAQQMLLVNELGRQVNAILNADLLLRHAVGDIRRTFGFHNVMVFMRSAEDAGLKLRAQAAGDESESRIGSVVDDDEGIVGRVLRTDSTQVVDDVTVDPDFVSWFPETRSEIAVPIRIDGRVEGVLNVESDRRGAFRSAERVVLETVANQLAIALANAHLFDLVKEREDRYRILVESNPGGVLHLDAEGRVVFANPAALDLLGLEEEALLTDPPLLTDLSAAPNRLAVDQAVRTALGPIGRADLEIHLVRPDGGARWIDASLEALAELESEGRGLVMLARDRSREKELQDRLYQSEKLSAIGKLLSGVAHELNNPLSGILGFAQLMLTSPPESWARSDVERIEANAKRCRTIVENLLAFARQTSTSKQPANMNDVIESVLNLQEYQLTKDDVEIEKAYDPRLPLADLDVNRWQQVFVNLITNAHQAMMESGTGPRHLRFETRSQPGAIEVRVSDSGPGIPPAFRNEIFVPFFTTKDEGTGLGLSICFGIVQDHGATIELDPAAEEGATFLIRLPLDGALAAAPEPERAPTVVPAESGQGRRILVIDDEPSVREVVGSVLRRHGYTVEEAGDGKAALALLDDRDYDVVLTDISMPGEPKGLDLFDHVEANRPELAERMIFLTGYGHDPLLAAEIEVRDRPCIRKPFDIHELARAVGEMAEA